MDAKYRKFYMKNWRRFAKLRDDEIFQYFKFEFLEDIIFKSIENQEELENLWKRMIPAWKIERAMKNIHYYSPLNKLKREYKNIGISIFAYQEISGDWKMIIRDENKGNAKIENHENKVEVIKSLNRYSKENRQKESA